MTGNSEGPHVHGEVNPPKYGKRVSDEEFYDAMNRSGIKPNQMRFEKAMHDLTEHMENMKQRDGESKRAFMKRVEKEAKEKLGDTADVKVSKTSPEWRSLTFFQKLLVALTGAFIVSVVAVFVVGAWWLVVKMLGGM